MIRPFKCTVELGCHERMNVVLTEEYNIVVNSEELTGTTEHCDYFHIHMELHFVWIYGK